MYHNDSNELIKPFFENLKDENIHDEKYIPLLKTFSKFQLDVLYQNEIITEEEYNLFISNIKSQREKQLPYVKWKYTMNERNFLMNEIDHKIEDIVSEDKIKELDQLLQEKDIKAINTITKSFLEVRKM